MSIAGLAVAPADLWLAALMALAAALYTSVGHAGASAYIGLMALFGIPPSVMRPTALALNILAAGIASVRYARAGMFRWRTLWPFLIGSLPLAFLGGAVHLPGDFYRPLVGAVLTFAGLRLLWPADLKANREPRDPHLAVAAATGSGVGLLSGLTGTGGGIFLSPILLFAGWASPRNTSGIAATFILANSVAGLAGNVSAVKSLPSALPVFAAAVLAGTLIGTTLGVRYRPPMILKALGIVLIIAAFKLFKVY